MVVALKNDEPDDPHWRIKLNRAKLLASLLMEEVSSFEDSDPVQVIEESWDGQTYSVKIAVVQQIGKDWGVILGEIFHNLRSSLDSLLFGIFERFAHSEGKELREDWIRKLYFPIDDKPNQFSFKPWFIEYPNENLIADLQSFQPASFLNEYVDASDARIVTAGHPLSLLQYFSNLDKHRKINFIDYAYTSYVLGHQSTQKIVSAKVGKIEGSRLTYTMQFEIDGGNIQDRPSFLPEFQLGVVDERGFTADYSLAHLLEILIKFITEIHSRLESYT